MGVHAAAVGQARVVRVSGRRVIVDRGSTTELQGWGGRTTYSFRIEFEGGIVGEFARPGGGANEEPYVTNLPGVAYTRGQELLAFRHVRV